MICIVDKNNKIIEIKQSHYLKNDNERPCYVWSKVGEIYTEQEPLEYARRRKLSEVDQWTASQITGGFISNASGQAVHYDSDKDTQLTMQGIALNVNTPLFAEEYPKGCPVRGYLAKDTEKTIFWLTAEQVLRWMADLSMHIGSCKQQGWQKQAEVKKAGSVEELEKIDLR